MSRKPNTIISKEVQIIHIASGMLSQAMQINCYEDTLDKENDSKQTKVLKAILRDISKKSKLFSRNVEKNIKTAKTIFDSISDRLHFEAHTVLKRKFKKQVKLNDDGELEANATLLAMALILEHQNIQNKQIFLPYKLANEVYTEFQGKDHVGYGNAIIIATEFVKAVLNGK